MAGNHGCLVRVRCASTPKQARRMVNSTASIPVGVHFCWAEQRRPSAGGRTGCALGATGPAGAHFGGRRRGARLFVGFAHNHRADSRTGVQRTGARNSPCSMAPLGDRAATAISIKFCRRWRGTVAFTARSTAFLRPAPGSGARPRTDEAEPHGGAKCGVASVTLTRGQSRLAGSTSCSAPWAAPRRAPDHAPPCCCCSPCGPRRRGRTRHRTTSPSTACRDARDPRGLNRDDMLQTAVSGTPPSVDACWTATSRCVRAGTWGDLCVACRCKGTIVAP